MSEEKPVHPPEPIREKNKRPSTTRNRLTLKSSRSQANTEEVLDLIPESPLVSVQNPPSTTRVSVRQHNREYMFFRDIDAYLERELHNASSDSDKIYVYQRAFEFLSGEFQVCRPLLEKIKQQYDQMSTRLLSKKREIIASTISSNYAEEKYSEMVTKTRKARSVQFKQRRAESEVLLDKLTELRLERSELLKRIENLKRKQKELSVVEKAQMEETTQVHQKIHDISDEIRITEQKSSELKKIVVVEQDRLEQTRSSAIELNQTNKELSNQLQMLLNEEKNLDSVYQELLDKEKGNEAQIIALNNKLNQMTALKEQLQEKLDTIRNKYSESEKQMKELLVGKVDDLDKPILDIIRQLIQESSSKKK